MLEPRAADAAARRAAARGCRRYVPALAARARRPGRRRCSRSTRELLRALVERLDRGAGQERAGVPRPARARACSPPRPARAPVVFDDDPRAAATDARRPARASAPRRPGRERPARVRDRARRSALAAARLAEVVTLWPGRDAYADHSADASAAADSRCGTALAPVAHELYLAHDLHLALTGAARRRPRDRAGARGLGGARDRVGATGTAMAGARCGPRLGRERRPDAQRPRAAARSVATDCGASR